MQWGAFSTYVNELLTVDADRLGNELFTPKLVLQAIREIQDFVPRYKTGHEDTYTPGDFTTIGSASQADFPESGAEIVEAFIIRTNETEDITTEHPCTDFPWERRKELTSGQHTIIDNNGRITISADNSKFIVYPEITASEEVEDENGDTITYSYELKLVWDGKKVIFEDSDETPFDYDLAFCVFAFVKREILLEINPTLSATFGRAYVERRLNLFLNSKTQLKS